MSIKAELLRYVETRPNTKVWLSDLETAFPDLEKRQIQSGMYQNVRDNNVTCLIDGQAWRWDEPESEGANKISEFGFTIIGESKIGTVVLEDATGELWRATKI